ncbi:hypothetical protein [Bacillus fonticola]|uniref:hypothetical protein n=1 Tax=Bacillus fonticola TaxID=2728853 RepID=UPI0014735D35|nr:hypothetical protein [Bacillus fonticola]
MSIFMMILSIAAVVIAIFSLVYTLSVAKSQKSLKGDLDSEISQEVQEHTYVRNPVFLAFIIATVLILAFIMYTAYISPA